MVGAEPRLAAPITVTVSCRTSRDSAKGSKRHPITLYPDGTIDTGHDLEQERILAALGGYLSCLELVDVASVAFLRWYAAEQRMAPRPIRAKQLKGPWRTAGKAQCCPRRGFKTPQEAADHARTPRHVALVHGAHARQLAELARGVTPQPAPDMPGEPWITMWDCGMHPDELDRVSLELDLDDPMPPEFYLGLMATNPDLDWLRQTIKATDVGSRWATWLAWSYGTQDRQDPMGRARWINAGAWFRHAQRLMGSVYEIEDVQAFAGYWGLSFAAAARELDKWIDSGVTPPVADLTGDAFDHLGYPPTPPKWQTRARLRDELEGGSEEELAVAIVQYGSVKRAAAGLMREMGL